MIGRYIRDIVPIHHTPGRYVRQGGILGECAKPQAATTLSRKRRSEFE